MGLLPRPQEPLHKPECLLFQQGTDNYLSLSLYTNRKKKIMHCMYIIKQRGLFIGSSCHAQKENFLWSYNWKYIQFSKANCKKISRTIYFYITAYTPQFAATSKSTLGPAELFTGSFKGKFVETGKDKRERVNKKQSTFVKRKKKS